MFERNYQHLGREAEHQRKAAVEKAERWTAAQAERLATTPEEILSAILRGWLPEQIAGVTSKYHLEDVPPLPGAPSFKVVREGTVKPVRRSNAPQKHDRNNEQFVAQTGNVSGAMADAFKRAPFLRSK